jgi:concanavalin A-like lectin/glucanase superfamily protein/alginate lyase
MGVLVILAGGIWFLRQELASFTGRSIPSPKPAQPHEVAVAPVPTPSLVVVETPAPIEPKPAPQVAVPMAPQADPLAWLLKHKDRWPEEVVLLEPAVFPAVVNGKVFGSAKVPVGTGVQLVEVTADKLAVAYQGGGARVPVKATNVLNLAAVEMKGTAPAPKAAPTVASVAAPPQRQVAELSAQRPKRKPGPFVHPGALHTKADFERMAKKVAAHEQPWAASWDLLAKSPHGLSSPVRPVVQVIRGVPGNNYTQAQMDAATLYQCALRYQITGDKAQADKAVTVLNSWARTMKKGVGGNSNFALGAGIVGYEFACGAEMMRDYPGWKREDFAAFKEMMKLFLGGNRDFLRRHNNTCGTHYRLNWDACNMTSMLAIGVFLDDEAIFNEALDYFFDGVGNGCIQRAIGFVYPNGLGQTEEMGRDQAHNFDGLGWLATFCEIAWNQGLDLYGYDNNRLLRGVEYVAKYNLGHDDVPFTPHRTCDMKYTEGAISGAGRGIMPPIFEMIYNHYVNRKGIATPYVKEAADKLRPDGGPHGHPSSYDWLGFGTLTYTLDPPKEDAPPSGVRASWSGNQVTLSWWGSAHAEGYQVQRATKSGGPYTTIGTAGPKDTTFVDKNVTNGAPYYYVVVGDGASVSKGKASEELEVKQSLVVQYDFEGSTNDRVGRMNAVAAGNPSYSQGRGSGKAITFDGKSDYLVLPTGVANYQDITIAAWVCWEGGKDFQRVFDFGGDPTKNLFLTPKAGDKMQFAITTTRDTESTGRLEAPALKPGRWTHVAVTLNSDTGTLYVDGEPVNTATITLDPLFTQNHCYIGKSQYPDPLFKGRIADFRIYNYALPASALKGLFQGGK